MLQTTRVRRVLSLCMALILLSAGQAGTVLADLHPSLSVGPDMAAWHVAANSSGTSGSNPEA
ncbi:MAG: hypothetical protein WA029_11275, partial [Anaerolineae bacterium]